MPRFIARFVIFLLLGAILNLAVAWTFAALENPQPIRTMTSGIYQPASEEGRAIWDAAFGRSTYVNSHDESRTLDPKTLPQSESFGSLHFFLHENRQAGIGVTQIHLMDMLRSIPPHMTVVRAGWPMHSFQSEVITAPQGAPRTSRGMVTREHHGIVLRWPLQGGPGSRRVDLPFRPIMPGFAINTLLYAAVVWLLMMATATFRRRVRSARLRCVKCNYDLRGMQHEVCPECGFTVDRLDSP